MARTAPSTSIIPYSGAILDFSPQSFAAWKPQCQNDGSSIGIMRYYVDSAYVPPTLKSDAFTKDKEALDYDRMTNPDTYSLDNYEDAGLAARKAIVAKAKSDTLRTVTTVTLEEMTRWLGQT
ncbi:hypothetical protein H257_05520 [Aphanomyces astaci]|uniref:Uncharacterized protein n=1 Tax=Aphanomyces astaci TaxID=112090 RepID=W4GQL0_APHAT|nr:hypothetical protein H257_05520 [Aphanomyces astaci]ETV81992.1 hypothetical protein H257_05520 [Aphanomyces astaci]|eukprot:XP_009828729.1 hypothetical protein H257_05520 [Aphanomyces astaci]